MGRGRSGVRAGGVTAKQNATINRMANRTRNLKNEQYRIIDENGDVVLAKKGGQHAVAATVGEKRENLPGAVSIHNHPDGGTFSTDDLSEFGFGARAMVVASPEGDYRLTNVRYGTPQQAAGWLAMRNDMEAKGLNRERGSLELRNEAQQTPAIRAQMENMQRTSREWVDARAAGKPQSTLDKIMNRYTEQEQKYRSDLAKEMRRLEVKPYDDYYKANASKYGFKYEVNKR